MKKKRLSVHMHESPLEISRIYKHQVEIDNYASHFSFI
jgi:hypothetical protein